MSGLVLGRASALSLRRERVKLEGLGGSVRVAYASDLHLLRRDDPVGASLEAALVRAEADVVVLGGDLIDAPSGLSSLEALVRALASRGPVLAVEGNHDRLWGTARVAAVVRRAGGVFVEREPVQLELRGTVVRFAGTVGAAAKGPTVLCAHDPSVFPEAARAGYGLVLAGHLHGGQVVLFERRGLLYPAAWLYPWNGTRFERHGATMLVSRGVSDTLPLRYNCPREVLVCELTG